METNYILSGILYCVGCAFLVWASNRIKRYLPERHGLTIVLMWLCAVFFVLSVYGIMSNDYRDGQIDALKGKYQYRMEINYDQHGTPKDTIYVKEEWRKNMEKDTVVIIPIRTVRDTVIYINR